MADRPRDRAAPRGWFARAIDSDVFYSFYSSPVTVLAALVTLAFFFVAIFVHWVAPHDTFDLANISIMDSELPPVWVEGGDERFMLGTDDQGRDLLSAIMFGMRLSLLVGFASVLLSAFIGVALGLVSGYVGGTLDDVLMRIADVQLSFPAILIALLVDGIMKGLFPGETSELLAIFVVVLSIAVSAWPQYARTVRASTMVEKSKEYIQAVQVIGLPSWLIVLRHVLPNVLGPVLVIATINLAIAIIIEATLSFLGVGIPPTQPSLGTLIRIGNNYLFSGIWWITFFPALALAALVLAVNMLGDWLRDALDPKLR
jgi:peptide/nickel transport system permease protein